MGLRGWIVAAALLAPTLAAAEGRAAPAALSAADRAAAFRAAGFTLQRGQWKACDDPGTASYQPGAIEAVRDLNGDGRPEAVITEGSGACFGGAEVGYALVSKQANGSWKLISGGAGIVSFLPTRGVGNWPDMEVGGPGFCFPVLRWNGREYAFNRQQYEGRPCRR